eukprot:13160629-Heterocapsa_arctica.AAC.1
MQQGPFALRGEPEAAPPDGLALEERQLASLPVQSAGPSAPCDGTACCIAALAQPMARDEGKQQQSNSND